MKKIIISVLIVIFLLLIIVSMGKSEPSKTYNTYLPVVSSKEADVIEVCTAEACYTLNRTGNHTYFANPFDFTQIYYWQYFVLNDDLYILQSPLIHSSELIPNHDTPLWIMSLMDTDGLYYYMQFTK